MKKIVSLVLIAVLMLSCFAGCKSSAGEDVTINVYNWGQYIAEGDDGAIDVIAEFEEAYPNIHVNYLTYDSNETMYSKLKTGGITVDVIIPSDYMIARLIDENMLLPLDFDNIPNYKYIDEAYKNTAYDPENKYSIPYTWGTTGIIYNTKFVDEADVGSWDLLWNEKYAGKILMFGNSRDAFGIAERLLGYSMNTKDDAELREVAKKLQEQKPLVQQYVMDEIFDLMENEEAWIAPYYAGDYLTMVEENEDLGWFHPKEGVNLFIDAICIPTCCQQKKAAETFINFLCSPEIVAGNLEWIGYSSPETEALQYMDEEVTSSPVAYPEAAVLEVAEAFGFLPAEINNRMEELWLAAKTGTEIK